MRIDAREMLAVGMLGGRSQLIQRIETLLRRGRRFTGHASVSTVMVSALALGALMIAGALTPRWIAFAQEQLPGSFAGLATLAEKKFDVATVRESRSADDHWRLGPPGRGSISIENLQLHRIVASSFRVQDSMVFGQDWTNSVRYDIVGKGPDPKATNPEVWEMMRSLLADRFRMKYHIETRQFPIYALVVAKGGPKLKRPEDGPCAAKIKVGENCGDIGPIAPFAVGITNMPVTAFIGGLARAVQDRPIVDKTGLTGKYDGRVVWMPDNAKPEDFANVPAELRPQEVSLFTALEQQLGLKLEAQRGPVQVVVIDQIERASPN